MLERGSDSWQTRLPAEWRTGVVAPCRIDSFHEQSVPASKWRGYDAAGSLCYYLHRFSLWDEIPDDEDPYRRLILREEFEGWRLSDGRWLRRLLRADGAGRCARGAVEDGFAVVDGGEIPRA